MKRTLSKIKVLSVLALLMFSAILSVAITPFLAVATGIIFGVVTVALFLGSVALPSRRVPWWRRHRKANAVLFGGWDQHFFLKEKCETDHSTGKTEGIPPELIKNSDIVLSPLTNMKRCSIVSGLVGKSGKAGLFQQF